MDSYHPRPVDYMGALTDRVGKEGAPVPGASRRLPKRVRRPEDRSVIRFAKSEYVLMALGIAILLSLVVMPSCGSRDHGDRGGWFTPSGG